MCIISTENIEGTNSSLYIENIDSGRYKYEMKMINTISLFNEDNFLMRENNV